MEIELGFSPLLSRSLPEILCPEIIPGGKSQGLKPGFLLDTYGPTKSRALIQNLKDVTRDFASSLGVHAGALISGLVVGVIAGRQHRRRQL
jgi:hypothetical protein